MSNLDGVILVNKPRGISSAGVVRKIKKEMHEIYKIGHAGTLDPFATGLLVCCINRATRLSRFFLSSKKKYKGILKLGIETDTQDLTGLIKKKRDISSISAKKIKEVISTSFTGHINQIPPAFSALKKNGIPLYKLARKGVYVTKPPRSIVIYSINICKIDFPEISFEISCSSGTYVRTICADIGTALGCGGHLKALHRIDSGLFSINEASDLKSIINTKSISNHIIPMAKSLDFMPSFIANDPLVKKIRNGIKLNLYDFISTNNYIDVLNFNEKFFKVVDNQGLLIAVLGYSTNKSLSCTYYCVF